MANRKHRFILMIVFIFITATVLGGCTSTPQNNIAANNEEIPLKTVYTSFYPIYDFTSKIAGDKMNVKLIIPAGAEPHDFEMSPKTYAEIEDADLIIINGLGIESFADKIISSIPSEKIVNLAQYTDPMVFSETDHEDEENGNETEDSDRIKYDPHVWLDPVRAMAMSEAIYNSLSETAPDNQSYYQQNYEQLVNNLKDLDKGFRELKDMQNKKQIIVSHNAFSYLADRYDLTFTSISGISSEHEPSLKDISRIIDIVNADKINIIFMEELSNEKIAGIISSETDAGVDVLYTIEGMTPMEIENGEDYFYKMNLNLEKIKKAIK